MDQPTPSPPAPSISRATSTTRTAPPPKAVKTSNTSSTTYGGSSNATPSNNTATNSTAGTAHTTASWPPPSPPVAPAPGPAPPFTFPPVSAGAVPLLVSANGGGKSPANPASPNAPTGGSGAGLSVSLVMTRSPLLVDEVLSEIFLGENLNSAGGYTTLFTTGGQIQEVIDWLNECYNPTKRGATVGRDDAQDVVQSGTIDPHTLMPVTRG